MRNSTLIVLSFTGLICLAASLIWMPLPQKPVEIDRKDKPTTVKLSDPVTKQPSELKPNVTATAKPSAQLSAPLLFPDWPKPALAIVATGEQHGYFEPCGCTANQLGGMSRRAGLFDKIQGLGWEVRGVDLGSLSRRTGQQAQLKFETTLQALRELKYVGLGLGPEELKMEAGYLLSQHSTDGDPPLTFLGANLVLFGSKDIGTPLPFTVIEHDGLKVGITSVMSDIIRREVIPDRSVEDAAAADIQWTDPTEALRDVMKQFDEAKVTFRVLLSQATLDESRAFAREFPAFNIVISAEGFGEGVQKPEMIGPVRMLQVGEKGKMAGVIGIYPDDKTDPVRFELVTLSGDRFADSGTMTGLMRNYQERLKDGAIVTAESAIGHPSGAEFVGASKCGECHTKAFEIFKKTPHSHAFESLDPANKRKGFERLQGVARTFDPECLSCHVTGWEPKEYLRFQSGFVNSELATTESDKLLQTLLAGNQCENCHGPGSRHIELIEADNKEAAIKEMKVTLEQAKEQTCIKCHDLDNSPNFKFEEYWEKVKHYGKD